MMFRTSFSFYEFSHTSAKTPPWFLPAHWPASSPHPWATRRLNSSRLLPPKYGFCLSKMFSCTATPTTNRRNASLLSAQGCPGLEDLKRAQLEYNWKGFLSWPFQEREIQNVQISYFILICKHLKYHPIQKSESWSRFIKIILLCGLGNIFYLL